ncbi:MAG: peptidase M16 [Bacteroidetes bacterium CG12_big_fil_rev_8_21_14_0_65_60_17]|nr:MAG: peptidase M16 [Bacteroidetes bacterium CG12_big_fil_rev_8_21_14_0_65_60_17]
MRTHVETVPGMEFMEECGGIDCYRLVSNGLQVLLLPRRMAPVATCMITYRVGSRHERTGETGATHFLEHMMFKGTEKYNRDRGTSVFNLLQSVGAQVNATTWMDRTNYYALLPREHVSTVIEVEADRMRGLLLREEDVASEKTVILNEFDRGENEPFRKLYQAVWAAAFEAHTYHHATIGWRRDIEQVTAARLRSFYDRYYWPENAVLSMIGDFDETNVLADICRSFGSIGRGAEPLPDVHAVEPEQRGPRRVVVRMQGDVPILLMGWKAFPARDERSVALELAAQILSGGRTTRLYRGLVKKGLATAQQAIFTPLHDPGLFMIYASPGAGTPVEDVERAVDEELERLVTDGPGAEEMTRALTGLEAAFAYSTDGSYSTAAALNEAIASGDWRRFATWLDVARSCTAEQIRLALADVIHLDRQTVGVFEPTGPS